MRRPMPQSRRWPVAIPLSLLASLLAPLSGSAWSHPGAPGLPGPGALSAQSISSLAQECGGGDPLAEARCREVALRTQAARSAVGLLAGGGAVIPGSAGTLGLRLGSVPRISVAAGLTGADAAFPGPLPSTGAPVSGQLAPENDVFASAAHLGVGAGIFDGFSPLPTVGGLLSLDVVGRGSLVLLPGDRGFDSNASSLGVGARVGLLRESFTLPGISLSATRRWGSRARVAGGGGAGSWDLSTTSFRANFGKDLLGVGVLLGAGWDRYAGPLSISLSEDAGTPGGGGWDAAAVDFVDRRAVLYGGASLNFLVVQLSAEVGWAGGFDAVAGREAGGFDPEAGTAFGSLGVRLTY